MSINEQLIHQFYSAFQQRDYGTMQSCYADHATFSDPVFQNLNAKETKAMWEMLCKNGKDLEISYGNISVNGDEGKAEWTAIYTFSKTRKRVVNSIKANFHFEDGKIVRHRDHFSLHNWMGQAIGITGLLFGWLPFMQNKVRQMALTNLSNFMKKE